MSNPNKTQYRGIPVDVLEQIARVITEGDKKYGIGSWKEKTPDDFYDALMRHVVEFRKGMMRDVDDGLHPLAHAIVNCIYMWKTGEIRPKAMKYPDFSGEGGCIKGSEYDITTRRAV